MDVCVLFYPLRPILSPPGPRVRMVLIMLSVNTLRTGLLILSHHLVQGARLGFGMLSGGGAPVSRLQCSYELEPPL